MSSKSPKIKKKAKENTLDYYISTNDFAFEGSVKNKNDESRKEEFLKKNSEPSTVIPRETYKNHETPDNFGYIKTRFGFIAIGNKKYKKSSPIAFSIVPKSAEVSQGVSKREVNSPNYYFGSTGKRSQKKFLAGKISFEYNPKESGIQKLKDDKDGIPDTEKELLYPDDREEYLIKKLEKKKNEKNEDKKSIDKKIEKARDIKEEKKEDNEEFLKVIDSFLNKMKRGELKKVVESDEANARRKRIAELSSEAELQGLGVEELRKRLKEIFKKEEGKKSLPKKYENLKLENLDKEKILEIIRELLIQNPEKSSS